MRQRANKLYINAFIQFTDDIASCNKLGNKRKRNDGSDCSDSEISMLSSTRLMFSECSQINFKG